MRHGLSAWVRLWDIEGGLGGAMRRFRASTGPGCGIGFAEIAPCGREARRAHAHELPCFVGSGEREATCDGAVEARFGS